MIPRWVQDFINQLVERSLIEPTSKYVKPYDSPVAVPEYRMTEAGWAWYEEAGRDAP